MSVVYVVFKTEVGELSYKKE